MCSLGLNGRGPRIDRHVDLGVVFVLWSCTNGSYTYISSFLRLHPSFSLFLPRRCHCLLINSLTLISNNFPYFCDSSMILNFFSLFYLAAAASAILGVCANPHGAHLKRHQGIAKRATGNVQLHKRFDGTRWTFYDVGLSVFPTSCALHASKGRLLISFR